MPPRPRLRVARPVEELTIAEIVASIPAMTPAELAQLPTEWMDPLVMRLWDTGPQGTSQLQVARGLGTEGTLIFGGKQSGKTAIGLHLTAAVLRGPSDPAVRLFVAINGLDTALLRPGPLRACMAALGWDLARTVQRRRIAPLLPPGTTFGAWNSKETATARLPNGNELLSKSWDQGPSRFQSDQWDWLWGDETPDEEVWHEVLARLVTRAGRWMLTLWPAGRTHLHDDYVETVDPDVTVHHLDTRDNPFVRGDRSKLIRGADDTALTGRIGAGRKGLVYPEWDRARHLVAGVELDDAWPRYWTIDPGTASSHWVLLRCAVDDEDCVHVYAEYRGGMHPLAHHVRAVVEDTVCRGCWEGPWSEAEPTTWRGPGCAACGGTGLREPSPEWVLVDPIETGVALELSSRWAWPVVRATRDVTTGMDRLRARLTSRRLVVHAEGQAAVVGDVDGWSLTREMERFSWSGRPGPQAKPRVVKHYDHAPDALRHLVGWLDDPGRGSTETVDLPAIRPETYGLRGSIG